MTCLGQFPSITLAMFSSFFVSVEEKKADKCSGHVVASFLYVWQPRHDCAIPT